MSPYLSHALNASIPGRGDDAGPRLGSSAHTSYHGQSATPVVGSLTVFAVRDDTPFSFSLRCNGRTRAV